MDIRWNINKTWGVADLEAVRRLYGNRVACNPVDGKQMPRGPAPGHVHLIGTEKKPLLITRVDLIQKQVFFIEMPTRLADAVHHKAVEPVPGGIEIKKGF